MKKEKISSENILISLIVVRIFSLYLFHQINTMPRRKRSRKVVAPPGFKGYKPYGHIENNKVIELNYEEYEAIKLADYDILNHEKASQVMGISRATFARIYESARRKIAKALVESSEIKAVYGHAELNSDWLLCNKCHARFNLPEKQKHQCPICQSNQLEYINETKNGITA